MIKTKKLDNGVTMVLESVPGTNSATLGLWVRTGAADEDGTTAGISHFIEHMMFKGTARRDARRIAEDVDRIGAQINAFTGKEATCYYVKTLASNMERSLEILLDMFTGSLFATKEINRERRVIREELKMVQDTPDEDAHDTLCEQVFRGSPLAHSIIGTGSSLNRINHKQIVDYLRRQYTRDSIVVAVVGNFDEDLVCGMVEEGLRDLPAAKPPLEYPDSDPEPTCRVKVKDIEQTHLCLGTRTIRLADDRYYVFSLLSNIMGGGMSSRFFQDIREEKGLAYSVYSGNSAFSHDGYFHIYAGVAHENVHRTIAAIREELERLKHDGVSEDELTKAKEQLKSSFIFGQENLNGRMFTLGRDMTLLGEVETPDQVLETINKVTMADIEEAVGYICDFDRYSAVAVSGRRLPLRRYMQE
ncbi:MAG: M16 family metallopeptidase [Anaerovoracaceae bacterium]|jgi:predicted Zn-dependent peptidase